VVELSLVSTDPIEAATLVNVYANTYVSLRENADREKLTTTKGELLALLGQIEGEIATIRQPITDLQNQLANGGNATNLVALLQQKEAELKPQLDPLNAQAADINQRLGDLNLGVELAAGGGAEVLSDAGAPDTPVSPNLPLNLAIGVVFGLFLGAALAFARDYFDDSVKSKEMVERVTSVPTLGLIPKFDPGVGVVTISHPSAPAAEAFRLLRTSVKFLGVERQVAGGAGHQPVARRGQDDGGGQPGHRLRPGQRPGRCWSAATCAGPTWRRCSTCRSRPGLTAVLIGDVTLPQAIHTVSVGAQPVGACRPVTHRPTRPSCSAASGPGGSSTCWARPTTSSSSTARRCCRSPTRWCSPHGDTTAAGHLGQQARPSAAWPGPSSCCTRSTPRWWAPCSTACRPTRRSAASRTATRPSNPARARGAGASPSPCRPTVAAGAGAGPTTRETPTPTGTRSRPRPAVRT
jgi:hypothetical protein